MPFRSLTDQQKTRQIPLMYQIYAKAENTVIWLGLANEKDFVMLKQLRVVATVRDEDLWGYHRGICVDVIVQMHAWLAVFLQRRWFSRSWVRQEVAASRECIIACGDVSTNLSGFESGIRRFLDVDAILPRTTASMPVDSSVAAVRFNRLLQHRTALRNLRETAWDSATRQGGSKAKAHYSVYLCREWFKLVLQGSLFAATDARDKVFSMGFALQEALGGSSAAFQIHAEFQMDYKLPLQSVYQNFVKALINRSSTLDPLSFFRPSYKLDLSSGLPTWVSDLRRPEGGCVAIGPSTVVGAAETQQLADHFVPLYLKGTRLGRIGQQIESDQRVKDLDRVRLDDLVGLGLYNNMPASGGQISGCNSDLWEVGQPMDTILLSMGYALFEVDVSEHARENLGLDTDLVVTIASRDAQVGDMVICAYGGFHPFVLREDIAFKADDGSMMQQFLGPSVVWNQWALSQDKVEPPIGLLAEGVTTTDRVAMKLGWRRWKPTPKVMNERLLGREEEYRIF